MVRTRSLTQGRKVAQPFEFFHQASQDLRVIRAIHCRNCEGLAGAPRREGIHAQVGAHRLIEWLDLIELRLREQLLKVCQLIGFDMRLLCRASRIYEVQRPIEMYDQGFVEALNAAALVIDRQHIGG